MLGQYLITFREVLDAALITTIVLAYLVRTGRKSLSRYIWLGASSATIVSIFFGASIWAVYGTLSKPFQALFEGLAASIAVAVLSSMIYWMAAQGRKLKTWVEDRVEALLTRDATFGLTSFAFIIVFREGLETVLFLTPFLVTDARDTVTGLLLGTLTSLGVAYGIFIVGMNVDIRRFFYFTSLLLVFLAGGLVGYGVHEIIEYTGSNMWGWLGHFAYSLDISGGSIWHHKGIVGSIFAVMFGYTVHAEWVRLIAHFAYLVITLPLVIWAYRKRML